MFQGRSSRVVTLHKAQFRKRYATDAHTHTQIFSLQYIWWWSTHGCCWNILGTGVFQPVQWVLPGALGHYWMGAKEECRMMSLFFIAIVSAGPVVGFEIGLMLLQYY